MSENPRNERIKSNEIFMVGKNLTRVFGGKNSKTVAVDDVDFEFRRGEIVSVVGESGSGKTTLAKMILGLLNPTSGHIFYQG